MSENLSKGIYRIATHTTQRFDDAEVNIRGKLYIKIIILPSEIVTKGA